MILVDENKRKIKICGSQGQFLLQVEYLLFFALLEECNNNGASSAFKMLKEFYLDASRRLLNGSLKEETDRISHLCILPNNDFFKLFTDYEEEL